MHLGRQGLSTIQKPASLLGPRHDAAIAPAGKAMPIAGNQVVGSIEDRDRKHAQHGRHPPRPAKRGQHKERSPRPCRVRRGSPPVVPNHDERIEALGPAAESRQFGRRHRTLKGREVEDAPLIPLEHGLDQPAAEPTLAVVQQQMGRLRTWTLFVVAGHDLMVNVFTQNSKPRKRGRPPGRTAEGDAARLRLYQAAIRLIGERGYEATTLRDVATRAGVSPALLYKYFPNKRAIVLALYDELSDEFARQATEIPAGRWRDRFMVALETTLRVLGPHRVTLRALAPVMVGDTEEGVFARRTAFSRIRIQTVFEHTVVDSTDAPARSLAEGLGRLLYLVHLGVILWWLLDRSPNQRATTALVALLRRMLPSAALTLRLPPVRGFVQTADSLFREALLDGAES